MVTNKVRVYEAVGGYTPSDTWASVAVVEDLVTLVDGSVLYLDSFGSRLGQQGGERYPEDCKWSA